MRRCLTLREVCAVAAILGSAAGREPESVTSVVENSGERRSPRGGVGRVHGRPFVLVTSSVDMRLDCAGRAQRMVFAGATVVDTAATSAADGIADDL